MAKTRSTTAATILVFFSQENTYEQELDLILEKIAKRTLIAYGCVLGPLTLGLLCCLPLYFKAYNRNLVEHSKTSLFPLIQIIHRVIKYACPLFYIIGAGTLVPVLAFIQKSTQTSQMLCGMFAIIASFLNCSTGMYQLTIAVVSIYKFINNRQPEVFRVSVSRENVTSVMKGVFILLAIRDIALLVEIVSTIKSKNYKMLSETASYYSMTYGGYQVLLYIGMILQFHLDPDPTDTHSDNVVTIHSKAIGLIKFLFFIVAFFSKLTGAETLIIGTLFTSIDWFLVPLVVAITEIRTNPNIIKPCEIRMNTRRV